MSLTNGRHTIITLMTVYVYVSNFNRMICLKMLHYVVVMLILIKTDITPVIISYITNILICLQQKLNQWTFMNFFPMKWAFIQIIPTSVWTFRTFEICFSWTDTLVMHVWITKLTRLINFLILNIWSSIKCRCIRHVPCKTSHKT